MTPRRLAAGLVLALAALWSCIDGTGPESRRAYLAIYPVFGVGGARAGGTGDVDSFVIRIVNPPLADQVIVRRIPPGQDTIQIAVSLDLAAVIDTVTVSFEGYSSQTGQLLYSGSTSVVAAAGVPVPVPVTANYVGPGQGIDSLQVSPTVVALAPGDTVTMNVTGFDLDAPMPAADVPVFFTTADPAVALVDASGRITAVAIGTTRVFATSVARSALEDTTDVTVATAPPPQPTIALSPSIVTITDTLGTSNPAAVQVNVTNGGSGTLAGLAVGAIAYGAGASGWLTASLNQTTAPASLSLQASLTGVSAGTYTATVPVTGTGATNNPQNVAVTFTVVPAVPVAIAVAPGFAVLQPGATVNLAVAARDANGNPTPPPAITYTSRATGVATVSAGGVVTGVAGGTAVLVATGGGLADSVQVAVAANGTAVVSAIADGRSYDVRQVGDTVRLLVQVDMSAVQPEKLGSYNAQLDWAPGVLRFVRADPVAGGFAAPTVNTANTTSGQLRFGAADVNLAPTVVTGLVQVVFVAQAAGQGNVVLALTDLSAAGTFLQMLPQAAIVSGAVRVQ